MRLDGVEVKVTLASKETEEAVHALNLPSTDPWQIYFVEDVTAGMPSSTPLLDENLIVRARAKTKGKDDVTVKLRPGRRSQLTSTWLDFTKKKVDGLETELKVQEDWAGQRRTLSISLTSERPDGLVDAATGGQGVADLLSKDQKHFIDQCSGTLVNLDVLSTLPAISALRWPAFLVPAADGSDLEVRAERWTVADLDFLELSIVAEADHAEQAQVALEAFLKDKGLTLAEGETKTSQVLQVLVEQAAGSAA